MWTWRWPSTSQRGRPGADPCPTTFWRTNLADTLTLDFQPPEPGYNMFQLLSPQSVALCYDSPSKWIQELIFKVLQSETWTVYNSSQVWSCTLKYSKARVMCLRPQIGTWTFCGISLTSQETFQKTTYTLTVALGHPRYLCTNTDFKEVQIPGNCYLKQKVLNIRW